MAPLAVIFDYGKVLSALPDAGAHTSLVTATGLDDATFEDHYWANRHAYDSGELNGRTYWRKISEQAGFSMTEDLLVSLIEHDGRMWGNLNQSMVDWAQQLLKHGLKVGVLSNMGDETRDHLLSKHAWLQSFHHLTWSCELLMAKPDAAIYLHTLQKLGVAPAEAIFIDDIQRNIDAARAIGIDGILFTGVAQLRKDLLARKLEGVIPFPQED